MKKQLIIIAIVLLSFVSWVQAQESGDFAVPLSDPAKRGKLKAHLNYGSITVKGTARKDILVKYSSVEGESDHDDEDHDRENHKSSNKAGLKRIGGGTMDLEVTERDNFVIVNSDTWTHRMKLEIEVPSGFDLTVSTYNDGDLRISNIQGELELNNYNGEISAENISGSVVATTYNGEIKVTFDKITEGTPMSYSTYNGDIDITFPATLKATLKMKTEQGEILSSFDMEMIKSGPVQKTDTKSGTYKVIVDEWVKGEVNGGGPELTLKNYNGDIIVRKK
jgi:Putative adhesin